MRIALRLLSLPALAAVSVTVSGCGFTPLYAQQGLTAKLSQIAVETPQTRTGYFLEQELKNGFGENTDKPQYRLIIALNEQHYQVGYRVDDTATRSELTDAVTYTLKDTATGAILLKTTFSETVTYNVTSSPFTGIVSQQDAQERLAASAARKIQTAVALYFHDPKTK
ncbi:LPS assembly lipoprotein LptE [Asticcacaulis solisilvae]|uniref:LPS assembly lipoprotein LptE n=1 Tax=Asticcacaulis solisilvae TaxID=1217274 RepID=UPI003FD854AA